MKNKIIEILKDGYELSTWQIGSKLGVHTNVARKLLIQMENNFEVKRSKWSTRNNIVWEINR